MPRTNMSYWSLLQHFLSQSCCKVMTRTKARTKTTWGTTAAIPRIMTNLVFASFVGAVTVEDVLRSSRHMLRFFENEPPLLALNDISSPVPVFSMDDIQALEEFVQEQGPNLEMCLCMCNCSFLTPVIFERRCFPASPSHGRCRIFHGFRGSSSGRVRCLFFKHSCCVGSDKTDIDISLFDSCFFIVHS